MCKQTLKYKGSVDESASICSKYTLVWTYLVVLSVNSFSLIVYWRFLCVFCPSGQYGIAAPWYFPVKPSFWADLCCVRSKNNAAKGRLFTNMMQNNQPGFSSDKGNGIEEYNDAHTGTEDCCLLLVWSPSPCFSQARALLPARRGKTSLTSRLVLHSTDSPRFMVNKWPLKTLMLPSMRAMSPLCSATMELERPPPCKRGIFSLFLVSICCNTYAFWPLCIHPL